MMASHLNTISKGGEPTALSSRRALMNELIAVQRHHQMTAPASTARRLILICVCAVHFNFPSYHVATDGQQHCEKRK